jgi:hypothetical protein
VLLALHEGSWRTVRVYDNAHGEHEMHRYTLRSGKQTAEIRSGSGDSGEMMRIARDHALGGYETMIEGWRR